MSYTRIPDLPLGGPPNQNVTVNKDLLVLEQDITRKITPLVFLQNSIPSLAATGVVDFPYTIPLNSDITRNVTVENLLKFITKHLPVINEIFYVNGADSNASDADDSEMRGRNIQRPYKTIKRAAAKIAQIQDQDAVQGAHGEIIGPTDTYVAPPTKKQYTIMVTSGDYTEINPIFLPPNTSLIGDNIRRCTIRPANPTYDLFWVSSACYVWGFTFRGHQNIVTRVQDPNPPFAGVNDQVSGGPLEIMANYGSAAIAFPVCTKIRDSRIGLPSSDPFYDPNIGAKYSIAYTTPNCEVPISVIPNDRPVIYVSPYVQGCTSYSIPDQLDQRYGTNNAGTGMRIDGSLVSGSIRSMVLDSFTQVNQGGRGIHIINHGYAQLVSIFTVATKEGIVCENGGSCSISTSNSTFGLSGLVARGKSLSPILSGNFTIPPTTNGSFTGNEPYGFIPAGNRFTVNNTTPVPFYEQTITTIPYTNLCFTVGDDTPWGTNTTGGYILQSDVNPLLPSSTKMFFVEITPNKNNTVGLNNAYDVNLNFNIPLDLRNVRGLDFTNAPIKFYARSMIETGSHTFEYMGTGTRMYYSIPANGGIAINSNEAVFDGLWDANAPGIVFFTSSNELGDFKVGPDFKIVQSTGTIQGDTFNRAILTLVTPLNIILE
jgi:hypothetical protein